MNNKDEKHLQSIIDQLITAVESLAILNERNERRIEALEKEIAELKDEKYERIIEEKKEAIRENLRRSGLTYKVDVKK